MEEYVHVSDFDAPHPAVTKANVEILKVSSVAAGSVSRVEF
jgi:hypothetical protein